MFPDWTAQVSFSTLLLTSQPGTQFRYFTVVCLSLLHALASIQREGVDATDSSGSLALPM